jgi:hypothetical protein
MQLPLSWPRREGSTLIMVMVLSGATLLILGSMLQWMSTNTTLTQRNNEYFRTVAVAEAATEKVISHLTADYKTGGEALVLESQADYTLLTPSASEDALFANYKFQDGQGNQNKLFFLNTGTRQYQVLSGPYTGLYGYATPFRIIANAVQKNSLFQITGGVCQEIKTATIPLFQFAIFYNIDMEMCPGALMDVTGPVHGNANIYLQPQNTLTFHSGITASGSLINDKKPGDPTVRSAGTIVFQGQHDSGTSSLNLPIGTNNSAAAVHQVVEPPPAGESVNSTLGQQRLYNQADMIIKVTGNSISNVTVTSGVRNNKATTVPSKQWDANQNPPVGGFLQQVSFFNKRENKTVNALQIDVNKLRIWSGQSTNILAGSLPAGDVTMIYVDDQRAGSASTETGVRLVNGSVMPSKGLTVVTPDPIYVQGDYNTSDGAGHTSSGTDTTYTKPASLIGDAITILSGAWKDANANGALSTRVATSTTVNAGFLAGIVPTATGSYSGGVENFPRFLEDWSGKTLTYNGSMVVMYPSRYAVGAWGGTGTTFGIYNPPTRNWAFDAKFTDVAKLPPGAPSTRGIIRVTWSMVKPGTTNIVSR